MEVLQIVMHYVDADYNGQDLSLIHDINLQVHIGALSGNGINWVGDWTIDSWHCCR